ncbi:hypothetical protein JCM17961_11400 [Endothiovibrio diazotrophicus]
MAPASRAQALRGTIGTRRQRGERRLLPAAIAPLMRVLVSRYREQCERLEREPDAALPGPVAEVFQRLSAASEGEA